MMYIAPREEE